MSRSCATFNIIVHTPTSAEGKQALRQRVSQVHADTVLQYIHTLSCPPEQKRALADSIAAAQRRALLNNTPGRHNSSHTNAR